MSAPTAPSPPLPAIDFADWLSPMLVKELRQGVRTRVFVTIFILLQALMLLNISLGLLVAANQQDVSGSSVFFWIMVAVPVLLILPLNGLGAIGNEIRGNTLELTLLTRLTAFRIVAGKWLATFVQSLLLVSAVLPYLVLRYFIGGVNVTVELIVLGLMLTGSALLCAVTTGISAYPIRVVRALLVLFVILFFTGGLGLVNVMRFVGVGGSSTVFGPSTDVGFLAWAGLIGGWAILLLLMLEVGAAKIAPPAENHSAIVRLLAVAALALAVAANFLARYPQSMTLMMFIIAAAVCVVALCEEPRWIGSIYRPFVARGWLGRLVGRLLYPGWHTGFLFMLAMFAAFGWLFARQRMFQHQSGLVCFIAVAGALMVPVAIVRSCFPKTQRALVIFLVIQCSCAVVLVVCAICDESLHTKFKDLTSFLPLCTLMMAPANSDSELAGRLLPVGATTLASLIVLLFAIRPVFRRTRELETESVQMPEKKG